jgi:hypothetical protein
MSVRHTHIVAAQGSRHNFAGGGQSVPPVRNRLVAAVKPHWRLYVQAATSRSALGGATPKAAAPPRRNRLRREDGGTYLTDPGGQLSMPPSSCRRHVAELPRIPPHCGDTRRPAAKVAARLAALHRRCSKYSATKWRHICRQGSALWRQGLIPSTWMTPGVIQVHGIRRSQAVSYRLETWITAANRRLASKLHLDAAVVQVSKPV